MSEFTFKDFSDDPLVIDVDAEGDLSISISDSAAHVRNDGQAIWAGDGNQIPGIIAALGGVASTDVPVRASDISYNEAVLRLASAHQRTVTFSYAKGAGNVIETRRLVPESLSEVRSKDGTHLTFTGYDPDRDEPRAYRLDRIKGEVRL